MELIDKQELLDWIQNCWDWATVDGITSTTVLKQTMTDISQLPTVDAIPRERIEQMVKEIRICKTENEMRIAERDYKNKLLISGIFSEVMAIIHKYTKEQTEC